MNLTSLRIYKDIMHMIRKCSSLFPSLRPLFMPLSSAFTPLFFSIPIYLTPNFFHPSSLSRFLPSAFFLRHFHILCKCKLKFYIKWKCSNACEPDPIVNEKNIIYFLSRILCKLVHSFILTDCWFFFILTITYNKLITLCV